MSQRYYVRADTKYSLLGHLMRTEEDGDVELGEDVWLTSAEASIAAFALNTVASGGVLLAGLPGYFFDTTFEGETGYDGPVTTYNGPTEGVAP